jgi:hypothetical protein
MNMYIYVYIYIYIYIGFWEIVQEVGFFNYLKFWRSAARKRRMHYIIIEYEKQIAVYDKEVKETLRKEIESNEKAVLKRVGVFHLCVHVYCVYIYIYLYMCVNMYMNTSICIYRGFGDPC